MENKKHKIEKPRETVILMLKTNRFEVDKQKLISKSQYFAALLSENYLEYSQTEYIIKYDIPSISLQDFIYWIQNNKIYIFATNVWDIIKFNRLRILLELSVLFAVDSLIEHLIHIIENKLYFMPSECVLDLWLLSQELSLNILRDISLAFCLDRFDDLPLNAIYELSKENFLNLVGNINIRSTKSYLHQVANKWMDCHNDFTIPLDILKNKETTILHSIVSSENTDSDSEQFIHCWDGNDFFELTSFKYPKDIADRHGKYKLEGMQIIGRRYSFYLCGGEFGYGTGKFNKNVWRYCLISKKWFLETVMPNERRNMTAAFVKNKLILVGGFGGDGFKFNSVDIYDIYTGSWTSGAEIPCESYSFYSFDYSVLDEKLIICGKQIATYIPYNFQTPYNTFNSRNDIESYGFGCKIYIYFSNINVWRVITQMNRRDVNCKHFQNNYPSILFKTAPCYLDIYDKNKMFLKAVIDTCNIKKCSHIMRNKSRIEFKLSNPYKKSENGSIHLYFFKKINFDVYFYINVENVDYGDVETAVYLDFTESHYKDSLHLHSIPLEDVNKFQSCIHQRNSFFNLIHPAHLHTTNLI